MLLGPDRADERRGPGRRARPGARARARSSAGSATCPTPSGFYGGLTGRQNLRYTARLNGLRGREAEAAIGEVLDQVGLTDRADDRVETYSRGMRQRLGIADALVKSPDILILDEPTTAIDPLGVVEILDLLRRLVHERGLAILLSSHLLTQVQSVCDRIGIFAAGRLVGEGTVDELASHVRRRRRRPSRSASSSPAAADIARARGRAAAACRASSAVDAAGAAIATRGGSSSGPRRPRAEVRQDDPRRRGRARPAPDRAPADRARRSTTSTGPRSSAADADATAEPPARRRRPRHERRDAPASRHRRAPRPSAAATRSRGRLAGRRGQGVRRPPPERPVHRPAASSSGWPRPSRCTSRRTRSGPPPPHASGAPAVFLALFTLGPQDIAILRVDTFVGDRGAAARARLRLRRGQRRALRGDAAAAARPADPPRRRHQRQVRRRPRRSSGSCSVGGRADHRGLRDAPARDRAARPGDRSGSSPGSSSRSCTSRSGWRSGCCCRSSIRRAATVGAGRVRGLAARARSSGSSSSTLVSGRLRPGRRRHAGPDPRAASRLQELITRLLPSTLYHEISAVILQPDLTQVVDAGDDRPARAGPAADPGAPVARPEHAAGLAAGRRPRRPDGRLLRRRLRRCSCARRSAPRATPSDRPAYVRGCPRRLGDADLGDDGLPGHVCSRT